MGRIAWLLAAAMLSVPMSCVYKRDTIENDNRVYEVGVAGGIPLYRYTEAMKFVEMRAQKEGKEHHQERAQE